jgi:putative alpha-1,2-mannosidase
MHGYGFGQDEDQGQLGAWYVMSSIGLFDAKGLTEIDPKFQIGSPLFDKVTIQLNQDYYEGETFVIETQNNSDQNIYIKSIKHNDESTHTTFIDFNKVVQGGKLELTMDSVPNYELK